MTIKPLLFLVLAFSFFACEKKVEVNIAGTVKYSNSGEPVKNAKVYLQVIDDGGNHLIDSSYTSEQGVYVFSFDTTNQRYIAAYSTRAIFEGIKTVEKDAFKTPLIYDAPVVSDLQLPTKKILRLHLKNNGNNASYYKIKLMDYGYGEEYGQNPLNDSRIDKYLIQTQYGQEFLGADVDTIIYLPVSDNAKYLLYRLYTAEGLQATQSEEISPVPYNGDTLYYKFDY